MFTHDDIFTPLAMTVIIDNKVRDPEMQEFCKQAMALCRLFDLDEMTEAEIVSWFEDRADTLETDLKGKRRNTVVLRALTRFKEDLHVENLYEAMVSISVSDKEYVREESELIKSAASIWGYQRPPLKVTDKSQSE
jgi:tellurite resistance protein